MDLTPLNPSPNNDQLPGVIPSSQPEALTQATPAPAQPQQSSSSPFNASNIYPSSPAPAPTAPSSFNSMQGSANYRPSSGKGLFGAIAIACSVGSIFITIFFIFAPSIFGNSETAFVFKMLLVGIIAAIGFGLGLRAQTDAEVSRGQGMAAMALGAIMLVNSLLIGSYYLKMKIEINRMEKRYRQTIQSYPNQVDF